MLKYYETLVFTPVKRNPSAHLLKVTARIKGSHKIGGAEDPPGALGGRKSKGRERKQETLAPRGESQELLTARR